MITLLALAGTWLALLQAQDVTPISLSEAIRLSISHSNGVRIARANLAGAQARFGQEGSRSLPHVSLGAGATKFDDKTTVSFPGVGSVELLPDHQEQLAVALTQNLDISGAVGAGIAEARLQVLSAKYGIETATQDQALAATVAFYAVQHAEQAVQVATSALDAYSGQLATATKLQKGGVGEKIDVYRAESQVADAQRELTKSRNDLDSAKSTLNDLIGRPLDTPLYLVEKEPDGSGVVSAGRSALIAQAQDRRTEALEAKLEVAAAHKGIAVARASSGPSLTLGLVGTHYPTTSFQSPRKNVGALALNFSIPLFDGGLGREEVKEARSVEEKAKAREDQIRREIALQVQNAVLDMETARRRLEAATVGLASAEAARKLAQQRFEAQVGVYLEVTDAEAALVAAQAAAVDSKYDLLTARARLARALNQPIAQ